MDLQKQAETDMTASQNLNDGTHLFFSFHLQKFQM